jgi:hypothetical protein
MEILPYLHFRTSSSSLLKYIFELLGSIAEERDQVGAVEFWHYHFSNKKALNVHDLKEIGQPK